MIHKRTNRKQWGGLLKLFVRWQQAWDDNGRLIVPGASYNYETDWLSEMFGEGDWYEHWHSARNLRQCELQLYRLRREALINCAVVVRTTTTRQIAYPFLPHFLNGVVVPEESTHDPA